MSNESDADEEVPPEEVIREAEESLESEGQSWLQQATEHLAEIDGDEQNA